MAIVLALDPLIFALPNNWLRGELWSPASGNTLVKVPWPNGILPNSTYPFPGPNNRKGHDGMLAFDAALHTYSGQQIIAVGASAGSEVLAKWLREKGPTAAAYASPSNVEFILTANPERKYNGACVLFPTLAVPIYPGVGSRCSSTGGPHNGTCPTPLVNHGGYGIGYGVPDATPYSVTDFARQYDGFADYPNNNASKTAVDNAKIGQSLLVHGNYRAVSLETPSNKAIVEGNRTYMITSPTTPVPLLNNLSLTSEYQRCRDRKKRVIIEMAYTRPTLVDTPSYL